ncbi:cytosine adenosine deaminase [Ligilactobacillus ceti DSM 22408]|uniref:tRNA-specific adenosine deaminase n=1 Tax=Ligilactobacillus ceti DSM 22408 TaxID=1122146 RepID=A0A0R2KGS4_9LACO|nr:cytosine adenosine deaminase [Ligilactobacillus ceti DSM 22408]
MDKVALTQAQKEAYMREALYEAKRAQVIGEVPIGCVIVLDGEIIGRGHNLREHSQDATMHAEMLAIQEANNKVASWRLVDAQLFVTIEPCPMCSGAIINSRISEVYYGAPDPKAGTVGSLMNLLTDERFNHQAAVESGILKDDCRQIMQDFFRNIRRKRKKNKK